MGTDHLTTRISRCPTAAWERAIAELDQQGIPVPLACRPEWARHLRDTASWCISAHDEAGRCVAAVALEVTPTRALPGHRIARGHHLGSSLVGEAGDAVLMRIAQLARAERRLLRLHLEFILRTPEEHARVGGTLEALGFRRIETPRGYRETLVIPLSGTAEELLASFSTTTRRDLRHWSERPVEMRPITAARYSERLNALARETFGRTGGEWSPRLWSERIALCEALPRHSRLVGLFRAGRDDPDSLLAYAWGCANGDYAHYDDAGSARVEDIKISMAYPLMWDLILWSREVGCAWFDMGGLPPASTGPDDPRAGIAAFKRRFSKVEVSVGEEWVLEPHPVRMRLAERFRSAASWLRGRAP